MITVNKLGKLKTNMKKVIYIEIDDEVTSIYDQIRRVKHKDIYLVIPRKAIIFQSVINLRILKSKLETDKKNLYLVTTDRIGMHLASQVGIPVYANLKIEEKTSKGKTAVTEIAPIQAKRNEILKDLPKRIIERKTTIGELIREYRDSYKNSKKGNTEILGVYSYVRPNRRFLGFVMALSLGLFFFISYIALPGAIIYVKPKFDNIEHSMNVTLADKEKNQALLAQNDANVIASQVITTVTKQTKTFETASKRFDGTNAQGFITIINTSKDQWPLKDQTRFQTEEGIVFRIQDGVFVPGQKGNTPGTLKVAVQADPLDIYQQPIGERGNIGPTKFFLPGLSGYNQKIIWGESKDKMEGGITKYQQMVQKEDIDSAKKQIEDNLVLIAKEDLNRRLKEMNELNNTHLVLLNSDAFLKTELQELKIPEGLEGSLQDKFEIFAQIQGVGIAYDSDQLFNLLKKNLKNRTHPDMQIRDSSLRPESITFETINNEAYNENLGQIKITVSMKGIQEYVIDASLQAGLRFTNKIKERVVGLSREEAEAYLGNLPEVEKVEIKLWPFWINKIPRISDNIEVKLLED